MRPCVGGHPADIERGDLIRLTREDDSGYEVKVGRVFHTTNFGWVLDDAESPGELHYLDDFDGWTVVADVRDRRRSVQTEVKTQFWRGEAVGPEGEWVDHVLIRTWGKDKDEPVKWRHRVITTTTVVGEWQEGRGGQDG